MKKLTKTLKSVRGKLFLILCVVVLSIILFLIIVNSFALEKYYKYAKSNQLKNVFKTINSYYNGEIHIDDIAEELDQVSAKNNFDIIIRNQQGVAVYLSNKDFLSNIKIVMEFWGAGRGQEHQILEEYDNLQIRYIKDMETKMNYIMLSGKLDNGYETYIRIPLSSITESVRISNKFLYSIAGIVIVIGGIAIIYISKSFSNPISELNSIAKKRGQTLAQMALSWVYSKEGITSVLIGASKPEQILENIKMQENITFDKEELDLIDSIVL